MKNVAALVAFLALTGCAGLNAVDCGPDWYSIGRRDGRLGAQPQDESYAQRCGVPVDRAGYREGWQDGVRERPRPVA